VRACVKAKTATMRGALARSVAHLRNATTTGRRSVGDLPVKSDPHVEAWGTSREHIEEGFRWNNPTLRRGALWIVGLPLAIYYGVTHEFAVVDERAGVKPRAVMGGGAKE